MNFNLGDEVIVTLRGRVSAVGGHKDGSQQIIMVWVPDPEGVMVRDLHGWPTGQHIKVQPTDIQIEGRRPEDGFPTKSRIFQGP